MLHPLGVPGGVQSCPTAPTSGVADWRWPGKGQREPGCLQRRMDSTHLAEGNSRQRGNASTRSTRPGEICFGWPFQADRRLKPVYAMPHEKGAVAL